MVKSYIAKKGNVEIFLRELRQILDTPESTLNIIPREDKPLKYSTEYCLRDLKFTEKDVREELKNLNIKQYVECCPDERNPKSADYYVFSKKYQENQVYIKLKIQSYNNKIILCMSFHYAEYELNSFPYK